MKMPTNDERREVAARLRVLAQASSRSGDDKVYATICRILLGWRADMLDTVDAHFVLALLADLMEPEERTCRIYDTDHEFKDSIRCSACQMTFRRPWQPFKFCPNCGARVVVQ